MEEIRAFIAIELPPEIKVELASIIERLKAGHERSVKWVNAEGIHLTLKFLGNVSRDRVLDINSSIESVCGILSPFSLTLKGLGAFPNLKSPRVAWIGIGGDVGKVVELQKMIDRAMSSLGFIPEKRPFSPHLTLGRVRDRATRDEKAMICDSISSSRQVSRQQFSVRSVSLMQSTLTRSGAIYTQLGSSNLTESATA